MRAIKFRMWNHVPYDTSKSKYFYDIDEVFICLKQQLLFNKRGLYIGSYNHVGDGNVFEQFTGKIDKNGIEIYEGDYLVDRFEEDGEVHESLLPVVWDEVNLMWCVDTSFAKDGSFLVNLVAYFGEHLEVKGNKHE